MPPLAKTETNQVRCSHCGKLIVEGFEGFLLRFTCPRCRNMTVLRPLPQSLAVLATQAQA